MLIISPSSSSPEPSRLKLRICSVLTSFEKHPRIKTAHSRSSSRITTTTRRITHLCSVGCSTARTHAIQGHLTGSLLSRARPRARAGTGARARARPSLISSASLPDRSPVKSSHAFFRLPHLDCVCFRFRGPSNQISTLRRCYPNSFDSLQTLHRSQHSRQHSTLILRVSKIQTQPELSLL